MGMRSSLVYINKNGKATLTTVQWATYLDKNFAAVTKDKPPAQRKREIGNLLKHISENYTHVSAVETFDKDYPVGEESVKFENFVISRPDETDYNNGELKNMPTGSVPHDDYSKFANIHLDDGIGVIYDERDTEGLTYFYNSTDENNYNVKPVFDYVKYSDLNNFSEYTNRHTAKKSRTIVEPPVFSNGYGLYKRVNIETVHSCKNDTCGMQSIRQWFE